MKDSQFRIETCLCRDKAITAGALISALEWVDPALPVMVANYDSELNSPVSLVLLATTGERNSDDPVTREIYFVSKRERTLIEGDM